MALLIGAVLTALIAATPVPAPAAITWITADLHAHGAGCGPALSSAQVIAEMKRTGINVAAALAWKTSSYDQLRGQHDDPASDAHQRLHWDVETSSLPGQSHGHQILLNTADPNVLQTGQAPRYPGQDYLLPNYDYIHSQGGLAGYAHGDQWLAGVYGVQFMNLAPKELILDVALERVDFLLAEYKNGLTGGYLWLWYQMLNAGFHIAPAGGSDYRCINANLGAVQTLIPLAPGEQLTYATVLQAVRDGRTVVRKSDPADIVTLRVNGAPLGAELHVPADTTSVRVEVDAASPVAGRTLVLVQDGRMLFTTSLNAALTTYRWTVPITRSTWLAARTSSAHTAATFVLVGGQPIRNSAVQALSWKNYLDDYAKWARTARYNGAPVLGSSAAAFDAHIEQAKQVWDNIAREAGGQAPLPTPPLVTPTPAGLITPKVTLGNRNPIPLMHQ